MADYLTVLLCVQVFMLSPYLSRFFSFLAAVLTTYTFNKKITFSTRIERGARTPGLLSYTGAMLLGLCGNYAIYVAVLHIVLPSSIGLLFAVGAGSLAGMGINFLLCHMVLFRKRRVRPSS